MVNGEPAPSGWELQRSIRDLREENRDLRKELADRIHRQLFEARTTGTDRRFDSMKADLTAETVERKNDIGKILAKLDRIAEVSETFRKQIAIMLIGWALTSLVMIGIAVRTQL